MSDIKRISPEEKELAGIFYATFRTPEGQRVLEHLNELFNSRSGFDPDTHVMAFHEGRRDLVLLCNKYVKIGREPLKYHVVQSDDTSTEGEEWTE